MARHGINQAADMVDQGVKDGEVMPHEAAIWHDVTNWTKTKRPPNRPKGRVISRGVTAETVREVKLRMKLFPRANQQLVATEFGLGSSGRVTDILNGDYDHLLLEEGE